MANPIFNTEGAVNDDNPLQVEVIGGGGGGGDASLSEQQTQTTKLTSIDTKLGTIDTDTGNIDTKLGTVNTNLGTINTTLGSQATATKQDELKSEVVFIKGEVTSIKNNTGGLSVIHSHKNDSFTTTETRDFGASAKVVSLFNDGLGDIDVAFSNDNVTFTSEFRLRGGTFIGTNAGEAVREQLAYRYARFTHTGTNSKYRVVALA